MASDVAGIVDGIIVARDGSFIFLSDQSWIHLRYQDPWKNFMKDEIREEIVKATGFCYNLFGIWADCEGWMSFDIEI